MSKGVVLLLDGQTVQAPPIAKELTLAGWTVFSFCEKKLSHGYYSKYVRKKVQSPSISEHPEEFRDFLMAFLQGNHVDVLFPLNDDSAGFLSENKNELIQHTNFIIPDLDIFEQAYDKNALMALCSKNFIPHPHTIDLELTGLDGIHSEVKFPMLIKPNHTTGGRGMSVVNNKTELKELYPKTRDEFGPCHLQEFIPPGGDQFKVQLFVDGQSNLVNSTVIKKIRFYPENGGSSCSNVTIENNQLVEICLNVLKVIKWQGFADFDLIEDPRDNVVKVIEINPRVPACIKSSLVSGIKFAENIADLSCGIEPSKYEYQPNKYLRHFGLELLWFYHSKKRWKTIPSWFKFIGKDIYYQDVDLRDPLVFFAGTLGGFFKQLSPNFRRGKSGLR